jgi:hypothetical protein
MKKRYTFNRLSRSEREVLEAILMEELDIQRWYTVAFCSVLGGETFVSVQ